MRVAVIGAGPIGLAAALRAIARGHEVTVLEARDVGSSLRAWGPTRFFTPLSMNLSEEMRSNLPGDSLLTGPEYVERVLEPIAAKLNVRTNTRVVAIGRRGLTRLDYAGHPLRAEKPFRILIRNAGVPPAGSPASRRHEEEVIEADAVLDATGSSSIPLPYGAAGIPPQGEKDIAAIRTLGDLHAQRDTLRGKRVLLIGHGHSAANAIALLRESDITWAVRTANQRPCEEVANDPLPERRRIVAEANDAASGIRVERRAMVERVARNNGHVDVTLTGNRTLSVDAIVALTGYRPASDFTSALALDVSPINEGGARLYRAISSITDCLSAPSVARADLESGEPNYYFIGARAYGRSRTFLLQTGFAQLRTIVDSL